MGKLIYKPIAIQNECLGGKIGTNSTELSVFVKYMAQGTKYKYYKTNIIVFPTAEDLDIWLKGSKVKILSEKKFIRIR